MGGEEIAEKNSAIPKFAWVLPRIAEFFSANAGQSSYFLRFEPE
jgi:hypothetical protein